MTGPGFVPRSGGVKIVFDVSTAAAEAIVSALTAAGFDVGRYYRDDAPEHRRGDARPGSVRLGAERPMREFTDLEQAAIVAAFDSVQRSVGFGCTRVGTDAWTSGGGHANVGEPRRPPPIASAGVGVARPDASPN